MISMGKISFGALDIERCENEPLRYVGAMQANYELVVFDRLTFNLKYLTSGLINRLNLRKGDLSGLSVKDIFQTDILGFAKNPVTNFAVTLVNEESFWARCFVQDDLFMLCLSREVENIFDQSNFGFIVEFHDVLTKADHTNSNVHARIMQNFVRFFKRISGYDRVMAYKFDADWNGKVIAEEISDGLSVDSYIDLNFPASDIPRQARELFLENRVRIIHDINEKNNSVLDVSGVPDNNLDLGPLHERAVSPVHVQYLQNMGVRSTLSISITEDAKLWGLVACHNYRGPVYPSLIDLEMCRALCDLLGNALTHAARTRELSYHSAINTITKELRRQYVSDPELNVTKLFPTFSEQLLAAFQVDAVFVQCNDQKSYLGSKKCEKEVAMINALFAERYSNGANDGPISTTCLDDFFPEFSDTFREFSGACYLPGRTGDQSLLLLRKSISESTSWGGMPYKKSQKFEPLTPRNSFKIWKHQKANRSMDWDPTLRESLRSLIDCFADGVYLYELHHAHGKVTKALAVANDAETRMRYQSLHDELTQLPNRRYLTQVLNDFQQDGAIAFLRVDLDRFKAINDTYGHSMGDEVLKVTAEKLRLAMPTGGFLSRVGGDEFLIIIPDTHDEQYLLGIADLLIKSVKSGRITKNKNVSISCSVGIAVRNGSDKDFNKYISYADEALYSSKNNGRGVASIISEKAQAAVQQRSQLGQEIRRGIDKEEFKYHFQPIFCAQSGALHSVEALIRWERADGKHYSPEQFLKIAEAEGLIESVEHMAFIEALTAKRKLLKNGISIDKVSVNLSSSRLRSKRFLDLILESEEIRNHIAFEILEGINLDALDDMMAHAIKTLKDANVSLHLDDFGTGFTSILSLVSMGPDVIKIDKQLVGPAVNNSQSRRLLESIVDLSKSLNIKTVAEGIETEAHATLAKEMGIDFLQGFYFAKPTRIDNICREYGKWIA